MKSNPPFHGGFFLLQFLSPSYTLLSIVEKYEIAIRSNKTIEYIVIMQDYFLLTYVGDSIISGFHADINKDHDAEVPAWQPGPPWKRSVRFRTPLQINNKMIERFLGSAMGANGIEVIDSQQISFPGDGTVIIESVPTPQMPGTRNMLSSTVTTLIENGEIEDTCRVSSKIAVSASVPSLLVAAVESAMAKAAEDSLMQFLNYTIDFITSLISSPTRFEELMNDARRLASDANIPSLETVSEKRPSEAETEDRFYSAVDFPSLDFISGMPSEKSLEAIFLATCYTARTGDQILEVLVKLQQQMQELDAKVSKLEEKQMSSTENMSLFSMQPSTVRKGMIGFAMISTGFVVASLYYWNKRRYSSSHR